MVNGFRVGSYKYLSLIGLIVAGEDDETISEWLDVIESYVAEVRAEIATAAADSAAVAYANAEIERLEIARLSKTVSYSDYARASLPAIKSYDEDDRYVISFPAITVTVGTTEVELAAFDLDLSESASWDAGSYDVAANRAEVDFFLYVIVPVEGDPSIVASAETVEVDGYTAGTDCLQIGGFKCAAVAESETSREIDGWTGLAIGDILPGSIWDLSPVDIPVI